MSLKLSAFAVVIVILALAIAPGKKCSGDADCPSGQWCFDGSCEQV